MSLNQGYIEDIDYLVLDETVTLVWFTLNLQLPCQVEGLYNASGSSKSTFQISNDGTSLNLRGIIFDTIKAIKDKSSYKWN